MRDGVSELLKSYKYPFCGRWFWPSEGTSFQGSYGHVCACRMHHLFKRQSRVRRYGLSLCSGEQHLVGSAFQCIDTDGCRYSVVGGRQSLGRRGENRVGPPKATAAGLVGLEHGLSRM